METLTYSFNQPVKAPLAEAYRMFTNGTALREWLCDAAQAAPRPSGRLYLAWNSGFYMAGEYTALEPERRVAFTWHGRGEPGPTEVEVTFTPQDSGVLVRLAHSCLNDTPEWAALRDATEKGWKESLENLASVLETGEDLRFTRRPMLGITLTDFNEQVARQLGIPVSQGVRLDGTVDGMGAQQAGLQAGDVVVGMSGEAVTDFPSLTRALAGKRAGDAVEVQFYRGPELRTTTMTLSGRPIPAIPPTPAALAEVLGERYARLDSELEQFFNQVSDDEAGFKPAVEEWSAKEVLAHLILGERSQVFTIEDLVSSQERWSDDFGGNLPAVHTAVVAVHPTLAELLAELKSAEAETRATLAALPPEFAQRRGTYWRMAYSFLEAPYHFYTHIEQMRASIEGARLAARNQ